MATKALVGTMHEHVCDRCNSTLITNIETRPEGWCKVSYDKPLYCGDDHVDNFRDDMILCAACTLSYGIVVLAWARD